MQGYGQNWYQQNVAPQIAQNEATLMGNGQGYGSYAGAQIGGEQAQGQLSAQQAGLNYGQTAANNIYSGRSSYLSGGPTVAANQNNAAIARGENVAGLQASNAQNQNSYNLSSAGMANDYGLNASGAANNYNLGTSGMANNYNLSNYQNQLNAYNMAQQRKAQSMFGMGALGLGASSLLFGNNPLGNAVTGGIGSLFSGGGGGGGSLGGNYGLLGNNAGSGTGIPGGLQFQ